MSWLTSAATAGGTTAVGTAASAVPAAGAGAGMGAGLLSSAAPAATTGLGSSLMSGIVPASTGATAAGAVPLAGSGMGAGIAAGGPGSAGYGMSGIEKVMQGFNKLKESPVGRTFNEINEVKKNADQYKGQSSTPQSSQIQQPYTQKYSSNANNDWLNQLFANAINKRGY